MRDRNQGHCLVVVQQSSGSQSLQLILTLHIPLQPSPPLGSLWP